MKITGAKIPDNITLLTLLYDRVTELAWLNSEDGRKNRNRPQRLYDLLTKDPKPKIMSFDSGEDFDRAYAEAVGRR